jgi:RNA recognition motif-containing protein
MLILQLGFLKVNYLMKAGLRITRNQLILLMNAQGNKLFVGNLSWDTTEDSLREAFSEAGTVEEVRIITHRDSGRSKGFGFVTMSSEEEAQKAIEMFDGKELDGREIAVNIAKPREDRPEGGGYGDDR